MIESIWDKEPDFVNETGTKWWKDQLTTDYAQNPDIQGRTLDAVCYFAETVDGYRSRALVMDGKIVEEDQQLEGIGVKIDILKFLSEGD